MNYAGKFGAEDSVDGPGLHSPGHVHLETVRATHAPIDAIVVEDAHLLFNAQFKRSGVDLVLSKNDSELVLHDYFKGEKRATLASPDGAHLDGDIVSALTGHMQYAQADGNAAAGKVIGHVTKLKGTATALRNGVLITLQNGDNVEKGDVVESGANSTLGITFIDGTVFGMSSNARMVLNEMVYDPNGSNNSSLLSLVAGTITFVAGETAKHGDMKVDTPVATLGIRGTFVLCEIDFTVPGQGMPDTKFQVLIEPDGTTGSYVLYDRTTLTPLAVVDAAGQQITISNGVVSQTTATLSPDVQQLISDVLSLKFSDNSSPRIFEHHTDTVVPQPLATLKLADGTAATVIAVNAGSASASGVNNPAGNSQPSAENNPVALPDPNTHVNQPPTIALSGDVALTVHTGASQATGIDSVSGTIRFADINANDLPTASTKFVSFKLFDAQHNDISANLTAQQLAQVAAVEAQLVVTPSPGNDNNGSTTWTYSVPDAAFNFLTAGQTLTLTYDAIVDSNFQPNDQATTVPFTITITVAGVVEWIHAGAGPWNVGSDWSSGGVPTANENVFITADPSLNTPVVVTINSATNGGSAAFAGSLTMNNIGGAGAELDNFNTLTIGPGGLNLSANAILKNFANISIGGLAEISQSTMLQNSGTLTLGQGGDFKDSSNIGNSGTLDVARGTLNVDVNIANNGGSIVVDRGVTLALSDGGAVAGGSLTLASRGVLDIEKSAVSLPPATPDGMLEGVLVSGTIAGAPSTIEVGLTSAAVLELTDGTRIADGNLKIGAGSTLEIEKSALLLASGTPDATLDGVTVAGTSGLTPGTIGVGAAAVLTLDDAATITDGSLTIAAGGTLDVESTFGATLDGASVTAGGVTGMTGVTGNLGSEIDIGIHTASGSILTLDDGTTIDHGSLTIAGGSTLDIESTGGATLLDVTVTGVAGAPGSTIEIGTNTPSGSILTLDDGTTIIGGTINNNGTIDVTGSSAIKGTVIDNPDGSITTIDLILNNGGVTVESGANLALDNVAAFGTTFTEVSATSSIIQIDSGDSLGFDGDTASGGTLNVFGILGSNGTSFINGATIVNSGTIDVMSGTLTIDATSMINNSGTLKTSGGTLFVDTALAGNAEIAGASVLELGAASPTAYSSLTVAFDAGSTGTLKLDHAESFNGVVSGFGTIDGTQANSDKIDLADINHRSPNFAEQFNAATLTVTDGTNTAIIHFTGNIGPLTFVDDGNPINNTPGTSGTIVFDPPVAGQGTGAEVAHDPGPATFSTVVASAANQTLNGFAASDSFVFNFTGVGHASVTDFHPASDTLQFNGSIFASAQAVLSATHDDGHGNTVIAIDGQDTITLSGVLKAQLHPADFHLA